MSRESGQSLYGHFLLVTPFVWADYQGMIKIREAHAKDHAFLVESQISMAAETEGLKLDHATVELGVGAVLLDPSRGRYFIAEVSGEESAEAKPIGCLLTVPEWSDWRNGTVLWIHSLFVVSEHRRAGVFSAMYGHLKGLVMESRDFRGLRLYVDRRNQNAQKSYEKLGMSKEHYEMYEWLKN